jgi:AcrR family transcriptional regulator
MRARPQRRTVGVHYQGDLRRALIDAAAAILDEQGADVLSLREVARRIGVSHAAPAHHFGDKAGLLTAVAVEGFELFVAHLGTVLGATADAPMDRLLALSRAYAEFAETHPGHFEVMFRPALTRIDDPDYVRASADAFEALRLQIAHFQELGWQPEGDTRELAAAAWAFAHGISVLRSQGSLAKHYPDVSLDGVAAITAALLGVTTTDKRGRPRSRPPRAGYSRHRSR